MTAPETTNPMKRRPAVAKLIEQRNNLLIVAGLGSAVWDVEAVEQNDLNFYILGAMGSVVPIAIGLALAQPERPVLALTGDAELLMAAGSIATASVRRPENLTVVVLDNGRFGETGSQLSHTGHGVDLAAMAAATGFNVTQTVTDIGEVDAVRQTMHQCRGPALFNFAVAEEMPDVVMPVRDGAHLKHRFRMKLLGTEAAKV